MAEVRHATHEDCRHGAVLFRDGEFYDVLRRNGNVIVLHRDGAPPGAEERIVKPSVFILARPAPDTVNLEELPVLDERTDSLRRAGIEQGLKQQA